MSIYPPPAESELIFNTSNWEQTLISSDITAAYLDARYLKYSTAQGTETFSNTINTGYSDVDGSTICNTFDTYSTPATTSLFDTTNNASQVIQLGIGQSSGTINLGKQYDGLATYGTNQVANWTSIGRAVAGDSKPELNLIVATSDSYIGHNQTTGELYIGTDASRTGPIYFATNASSVITHNIGGASSTVDISGSTTLSVINSRLDQTNGTLYMTDDASVLYSYIYNELNVINVSTSTKTLTLPSTIANFTFWITTRTNDLIISSPVKQINFGCDPTNSLTIGAGSVVCIVGCVGSDSFSLIYINSTLYRPLLLYPTATTFAPTSLQSGYVYFNSTITSTVASGSTGGRSTNITIPLAAGVYFVVLNLKLTSITAGLKSSPINFIALTTVINSFTNNVNNITQGGGGETVSGTTFSIPASSTYIQLNVVGYVNISTATTLYCFARTNGQTNLGGYTFNTIASVIKIV